jgi:hypothetical protein
MKPPASTLIDRTGVPGPPGAPAELLGAGPGTHEEVAALLLPMVWRAARTERGPAALVSWLRHRRAPLLATPLAEQAAGLAEDLARLLLSAGPPDDTLGDP